MDQFFKQLKREAAEFRLEPERKARMRDFLAHYLRTEAIVRDRAAGHPENIFLFFRRSVAAVTAFSVLVLAGGGTSLAAEGALPGDLLYPVKVSVNEEVRAALAFNTEAKAEWEIERAERRLDEVTEVRARAEGETVMLAEAEAKERFEVHAAAAEAHLVQLEAEGNVVAAADLASRFETGLSVRGEVLSRIAMNAQAEGAPAIAMLKEAAPDESAATMAAPTEEPAAAGLALRVADAGTSTEPAPAEGEYASLETGISAMSAAEPVADTGAAETIETGARTAARSFGELRERYERELQEQDGDTQPRVSKKTAERKLRAAEKSIASARSYLTRLEEKQGGERSDDAVQLTAEDRFANARSAIEAAENTLAAARVRFEAEAYADAFTLAGRAAAQAETVRILLSASERYRVEWYVEDVPQNRPATPRDSIKTPADALDRSSPDEPPSGSVPPSMINPGVLLPYVVDPSLPGDDDAVPVPPQTGGGADGVPPASSPPGGEDGSDGDETKAPMGSGVSVPSVEVDAEGKVRVRF